MFPIVMFSLALIPLLAVIQVDDAIFEQHLALFKEALRLSDITVEKACLFMGIDVNQFRRQTVDRDGHVSWTRMLLLPARFHQWYHLLASEAAGLPELVVKVEQRSDLLKSRRQLRMHAESISAESRIA